MEKKVEEMIKTISKIVDDSKKKNITDFDSGLLQDSFDTITGTPQEKYERWSKRLMNIATRLENLRIKNKSDLDDERYNILKDIDEFLDTDISKIRSLKTSDGRHIILQRNPDDKLDFEELQSCDNDSFSAVIDNIREEQYLILINKIKKLEYKSKARLDDTVFPWHRSEMITDIESSNIGKEES